MRARACGAAFVIPLGRRKLPIRSASGFRVADARRHALWKVRVHPWVSLNSLVEFADDYEGGKNPSERLTIAGRSVSRLTSEPPIKDGCERKGSRRRNALTDYRATTESSRRIGISSNHAVGYILPKRSSSYDLSETSHEQAEHADSTAPPCS